MLRSLTALILIALLLPLAGPGAAQSPLDYGRLLGTDAAEAEAEAAPQPRQSRPAPQFDPARVPSAEDYARITSGRDAAMIGAAIDSIDVFRARLIATLTRAPDAFPQVLTTLEAASPTGRASYFAGVAVFAALLLAVGRAVNELFASYVARPLFVGQQRADPQGYIEKLPVLAYRVLLSALGTALTLGTAAAVGLVYHTGHEATLTTVLAIFLGYGAIRMIDTLWRMALCPFLPNYRIPRIGEREARRLYRWLTMISGLGMGALALTLWFRFVGIPRDAYVLISIALSGLVVLGLLMAIRVNYRAINDTIRGGRAQPDLSWLTLAMLRLWAPAAVVYLVASWAKLAFDLVMGVPSGLERLILPYLVLVGGLVVYAGASYAIERVFTRRRMIRDMNARARAAEARAIEGRLAEEARSEQFGASDADADDDGEEGAGSAIRALAPDRADPRPPGRGMKTFEDLARRIASLLAIGTGAWILIYAWGGMEVFGETMLFGIAEDVIDILLFGYIAFHAVRIWIDQKIAQEVADERPMEPGEGEGGGAGASRLATLLPLVRNFILSVMGIAIGLVLATELGFNVAPLFAGAGIVGLAIGFGSQTLVRDILSGAFFLMDDAFRRGEYIDVGDVKGTVEKISLRSFQLRHHLGMLHTIPFGELKFLTNYSRDWVMMKLPLRVTYDTDVDHVRRLIKKLGQELLDDPEIGSKFLQPLKSQGVIQMEDSAMILRVKFMCRPGEQWVIRKRVYQELRELFAREGIKFAHREVTVRIPDLDRDRSLAPQEAEAIGGAARTAVEMADQDDIRRLRPTGTADDR